MASAADGHFYRSRHAAHIRRRGAAAAMPAADGAGINAGTKEGAAVIRRLPRGDDGSGHKLFLVNRLLLEIVKARQTVGDGLEFGGGREI
jgi:hypothetical protein